jgi:hypothetical protein
MEDLEEKIKEIVGRVARIRPATLDEAELLTTQAVQALTKLVGESQKEVVKDVLNYFRYFHTESWNPVGGISNIRYIHKHDVEKSVKRVEAKYLSTLSPEQEACEHNFIDATNEKVSGTDVCTRCGEVRGQNDKMINKTPTSEGKEDK